MEEGQDTPFMRALLRRHEYVSEDNPPLSILFERYYKDRSLSGKTRLEWDSVRDRFIKASGDMPVRAITLSTIRGFKDGLLQTTSGRTGMCSHRLQ